MKIELYMLGTGWYKVDKFPNKPFYVSQGKLKYYINSSGELYEDTGYLSSSVLSNGVTRLPIDDVYRLLTSREDKDRLCKIFNLKLEPKTVELPNGMREIHYKIVYVDNDVEYRGEKVKFDIIDSSPPEDKTKLVKQQKPII